MTRVLITGGSRGIGRALAEVLSGRGAEVIITGRDGEALEAARSRLGGRGRAIVLDAADTRASVEAIRALDREAGLDLVIANAGVGMPDPDMTAYSWEALAGAFHVNFCGAAATLTAALPAMVTRGRGHLVGIGSFASFGPLPSAAAYCAPKAGLAMLLRCLRLDLAGTGVAVTTVNLGFVRTRMVARSEHIMPQLLEPDEAARRIADALAKRPRSITLPRALSWATRALEVLPDAMKERALAAGRTHLGR